MDDAAVIAGLKHLFSQQLAHYTTLNELARKVAGKLALNRGDIAALMPVIEEKQRILQEISRLRDQGAPFIKAWQQRKAQLGDTPAVGELTELFDRVQQVIRTFLESEEQVETFAAYAAGRKE